MTTTNFKRTNLFFTLLLALFSTTVAFAQTSDNKQEDENPNPLSPNSDFRTWSVALNVGGLSQYTVFLGSTDFKTPEPQFGYGLTVKKQLVPSFAVQADFFGGKLAGKTSPVFNKFNTTINYAASLAANFKLLDINWRQSETFIAPYITLGGGFINYTPTTYDNTVGAAKQKTTSNIVVPVGLGVRIGLSPVISLDLGYQVDFVDGDNLDGFVYNGNADKFSYTKIGIEFTLGKSSKPRLSSHNVVPAMRQEYVFGLNSLQSQVNSLKKTTDSIQIKNALLQAKLAKTLVDSDGDGVADQYDQCPNTPKGVKVDGSGCPLPEAPKPEIKYVYVNAEDKKVVEDVISSFELMKSTISPSAYANLDKLAELLKSKNISLRLDGYTDNTGPDWRNLAISKSRANAVKKYLVNKGVDPNKIEVNGYGSQNPIASNDNFEGRKLNRRVVFTLVNGIDTQK